ncbi:MAG: hypothetical protein HC824_15355 [Synechococcales cyanobacterium RM1_1_8]|nr:hypothetical protein [Synechococcales cyanobacterium RM1_1_8]
MHQAIHQQFTAAICQRYQLPASLRIREYCDGEHELSITVATAATAHRLWQDIHRLSRAAERLDCLWLCIDIDGLPQPYRRCPLEWALFFGADDVPRPLLNRKSERG